MSRKKLPHAKDWRNRNIEDWNVTTFHAYLIDLHEELFGIDYVPFANWQAEQGTLARLIGKQGKPGKYDKELIRQFIEYTFKTYRPNPQYPGTSFGFVWKYRQQDFQRVQFSYNQGRNLADTVRTHNEAPQITKHRAEQVMEEVRNNSETAEEVLSWF